MIKNNIKKEFNKGELQYIQVKNEGNVYMYSIIIDGKQIAVDVFKGKYRKVNDRCDYERYVYPSDTDFGNTAFSFGMYAINKAELKYQELIKHQQDNTHQPSI